jgi:TM2 domain-containing membrane protein YozV
MYKKLLSLFLCLISIIFVNNPALAIEKNQTNIDNYKPELTSFMNVSENSEPIYLARERKTREDGSTGTGQMSPAWIGSIFIVGLGQMLLGDVGRGVLFLIGTAVGYALFVLPGLILHIWCIIDAYNMAKAQAEGDEEARLLNERIAQVEKVLNRVSASNAKLNYSLASF